MDLRKSSKESLLTIVIPCFNEAENIPIILNRFKVVEEKFKLKNIFKY